VSPVVQRHVTESVCDARLAVQHLIDEVRAAFGEMDELLERAERLIASKQVLATYPTDADCDSLG